MPQREPALLWLRDCALTALVLALCTLTSWVFFRLDFVSSNYILTYILGVMYINVFTSGLVYGVVASLFSVMLVNYMFIAPFMQFRIRSDDMVTAVVMLCVSLLCSSLTGRIKVQAAQSERKADASQVLLEASRSLLGAEAPDTILRITATQLGKLLERPVCFAPAPEHIAPGTLILPPPAQTDYRSCPALHEFSTYEHNLALSILDVCSLALEKEASNRARREIEEAARQEQLRANLLRSISHDLRTPLTLIKGYAETVRDITGDDKAKRTEQCSIIVDETDRLSALVNSVMELSKVSSGAEKLNPVDFDMSQLCFEVAGRYDAVCEQNGWTLQLEANKECMVRADPAMMERVLHNLLGNATHHMGADGVFVLRAIPMPNGGCRVEVEDHGPGIPPEELPHLFDRYYRARQDAGKTGTGLGLSITKAILQQHDFPFGVNSTVGKGSTFWFEMKAPQ